MTDPQIETEEEAHERKSKLFDIALNLLTAKSMVFSIKNFIPITFQHTTKFEDFPYFEERSIEKPS